MYAAGTAQKFLVRRTDHKLRNHVSFADVDVERLARQTMGCSGADLENVVNQAALKAAVDECSSVSMAHMEYAFDKMVMGMC